MTAPSAKLWAVVPAAGIGSRMQAATPKQYLSLAGKPVLSHSLDRLLALPIEQVVVALSASDSYWPSLPEATDARVLAVEGGRERADSVLAGLNALADRAAPDDWVLVHDAARPCVLSETISEMLVALADDPVGGIMATPIADTVKQASQVGGRQVGDRQVGERQCIAATLDRSRLWAAQTPQLFRYALLKSSLEKALAAGAQITDEASALEWTGYTPQLFAGSKTNFKITVPEDIQLAELILAAQGE